MNCPLYLGALPYLYGGKAVTVGGVPNPDGGYPQKTAVKYPVSNLQHVVLETSMTTGYAFHKTSANNIAYGLFR